jgi:GT2 family glycosyltransferase
MEWIEARERLEEAIGGPERAEALLRGICAESPNAGAPAMCLARRLCRTDREGEAEKMLVGLQQAGFAEAAFYLGVSAVRRGAYGDGLLWMRRARDLDPTSEGAQEQIEKLEAILGPTSSPQDARAKHLPGPHVGKLRPSSKRHSVVVVTFNSKTTLEGCLRSVLKTLGPKDEIVLVDNASTDGSLALAKKLLKGHKRSKILPQTSNLGYAPAANLGLLASLGEYLVLLNPDTEVSCGWLDGLQSRIDSGFAAVGPVADNVGGDQFVSFFLPKGAHPPVSELSDYLKKTQSGRSAETRFLVGFCLMTSRAVLNDAGLLFEKTKVGADDLEFSWRLRMLGHRLAVVPEVFVRHVGNVSFNSLATEERSSVISESDAAFAKKLADYYGPSNIPSSMELFGSEVFEAALVRNGYRKS